MGGVNPLAGGRPIGQPVGDAAGDLVVKTSERVEHGWGYDPAFAAVQKYRLGNCLIEEACDSGGKASFGEDAG